MNVAEVEPALSGEGQHKSLRLKLVVVCRVVPELHLLVVLDGVKLGAVAMDAFCVRRDPTAGNEFPKRLPDLGLDVSASEEPSSGVVNSPGLCRVVMPSLDRLSKSTL